MFRDLDSRPGPAQPAPHVLPRVEAARSPGRLTARWLRGPDGRLERIWVRISDAR